jgi:hypothetical protein
MPVTCASRRQGNECGRGNCVSKLIVAATYARLGTALRQAAARC